MPELRLTEFELRVTAEVLLRLPVLSLLVQVDELRLTVPEVALEVPEVAALRLVVVVTLVAREPVDVDAALRDVVPVAADLVVVFTPPREDTGPLTRVLSAARRTLLLPKVRDPLPGVAAERVLLISRVPTLRSRALFLPVLRLLKPLSGCSVA